MRMRGNEYVHTPRRTLTPHTDTHTNIPAQTHTHTHNHTNTHTHTITNELFAAGQVPHQRPVVHVGSIVVRKVVVLELDRIETKEEIRRDDVVVVDGDVVVSVCSLVLVYQTDSMSDLMSHDALQR